MCTSIVNVSAMILVSIFGGLSPCRSESAKLISVETALVLIHNMPICRSSFKSMKFRCGIYESSNCGENQWHGLRRPPLSSKAGSCGIMKPQQNISLLDRHTSPHFGFVSPPNSDQRRVNHQRFQGGRSRLWRTTQRAKSQTTAPILIRLNWLDWTMDL